MARQRDIPSLADVWHEVMVLAGTVLFCGLALGGLVSGLVWLAGWWL